MTDTVGYELFLPAVAAAIAGKQKDSDQLNQSELKAVVAVVFRDSVIEFMHDSLLYRVSVPVDLYRDVKRYDLIPPDGYIIEDVVRFDENKTKIPPHTHDTSSIYLTCCPKKDVDRAFYAVLALVPKRLGHACEFDAEFLEKHYDVILANMMYRLMGMEQRRWRSRGAERQYRKEYTVKLNKARRRDLSGGAVVKIKTRRLSGNDASC